MSRFGRGFIGRQPLKGILGFESPTYGNQPAAPTAVTNAATNVANASTTLNGTVTPNGPDATVHFEWGLTAAYGNSTANQDAGTGFSPVPVSATINGLASGTTYHYRVDAINSVGVGTGGDQTFTTTTVPAPVPYTGPAQQSGSPFTYYCYDLLTGTLIGSVPMRAVQFGQQLNTLGTGTFTLDLSDPRVQATNPIACTIPNRTLIVIDYQGAILWAGISSTRRWNVSASTSDTQRLLTVQAVELWSYFQQRIQATDYSAPPSSGIVSPMTYWTATPWDASLIGCQVIADAIGFSDGIAAPGINLLGGLGLLLNGATPNAANPPAPVGDYVAVTYPFTSMQTVDTIITQLSQLGLGVGFDFGVDVAYSGGTGSAPVATINLSYPRRGRTVAQNNLMLDMTTARSYEFPEDGTQTANQIYELGGSGAIVVSENINPINQGYPLWERVISRANAQSQNIINLLGQSGLSDLALYSYAPVVPTVTIGMFDPNLPLGSFTIGDDVEVVIPSTAGDGGVWDPRFPAGLNQEWRIVGWQASLADQGDPTVTLTLNQPPFLQALSPAV